MRCKGVGARSACRARKKIWEERNLWKRAEQEIKAARRKAAAAASAVKPVKKNRLERVPKDSDVLEISQKTKEVDDFFLVPEKHSANDDFYTVVEKTNAEDDFFLVPEKKD